MSKSLDFIKNAVLTDANGNRSRIIKVRGAESGLDHFEITTQSREEREDKVATVHRIYTEEVSVV
jgi:hypothetical protein